MAAFESFGKVVTGGDGDVAVQVSSDTEGVYSLVLQALDTNTGDAYVGVSTTMNRSTLEGVVYVIAPGGTFNSTAYGLNGVYPNTLYIKTDVAGEGVLASAIKN